MNLKNLLNHNKNERRGLFVFILIMFVALVGRYIFLKMYTPSYPEYEDLVSQVEFVEVEQKTNKREYKSRKKSTYKKREKQVKQQFQFDPNTISVDSLTLLGIPKYIASNLVKYRDKGGKFRKTEDVRRIYGMEKYYDDVANFISIDSSYMPSRKPKKAFQKAKKDSVFAAKTTLYVKKFYPKKQRVKVDINTASIEELEQLHGVGSFYAKMIAQYREKLGGYSHVEQITEAYRIPDTILTTIGREYILLDATNLTKINLNTANFKTLIKHPYINKNQTKAILNYRKVHGAYKSIDDIKNIVIIKEEDYQRLKPYLKVAED